MSEKLSRSDDIFELEEPRDFLTINGIEEDASEAIDSLEMYFAEVREIPVLSVAEQFEQAERAENGDASARNLLVVANLKLVVVIAKRYRGLGLDFLDLIQEGNRGLQETVDKYDRSRGVPFHNFVAAFIEGYIKDALTSRSRTIRLPGDVIALMPRIGREYYRLAEEFGRKPTNLELAEQLDMALATIVRVTEARKVKDLISLDEPIIKDSSRLTYADLIEDERNRDPGEMLEEIFLPAEITSLLDRLNPRYRTIIEMRFGLNGHPEMTLQAIGDTFGVTKERIRQIEEIALAQLRRYSDEAELRNYLD
jgi:RNA polymerase primary sigma factor